MMLEVGYLHIDNPIAVITSHNQPVFNNAAGLLLLDDFDLDEVPLDEMQVGLEKISQKGTGAFGLSVTCSCDEPLLEAARLASKNLCLLDLRLSKVRDPIRLLELIPRLKHCGVTLSLRIRPEDLSNALLEKLNESELDRIHLDLRGLNGAGPKMVKKAKDSRGPVIMALADIIEFEDARNLLAMGADVVSLRGADPEFAEWLSGALQEYDSLSGWCNAPKHICAGGDLRGLAFCCPPVKKCPVLAALKRAGMTPEEFMQKKLSFARGTPLEKGEGTCFGSLVWCCKISKLCYLRDAALARIGLSAKEYMELKKKLAKELLSKSSR
ncbi:MAG: methanogenesis marker 9 domain-containing protein [Methanothrix sp.]|nr:methanogenesis marker 9 domain-containing protein [Methanothrix sp.]